MRLYTTRPVRELIDDELQTIIRKKPVVLSPHALDHLSTAQRKVFKGQELIDMLAKESPRKAYLQANGRYCAYFRKAEGYRKLILDCESARIIIVTFMDVPEIPRINLS